MIEVQTNDGTQQVYHLPSSYITQFSQEFSFGSFGSTTHVLYKPSCRLGELDLELAIY